MRAAVVIAVVALAFAVAMCDAAHFNSGIRRMNRQTLMERLKDKPSDVKAAVLLAESHRDYFKGTFCTDSVSFPGNAKVGFSPLTQNPFTAAGKTLPYPTLTPSGVAMALRSGDEDTIVAAGEKVYANKEGCCATYAAAMFAKLAPTTTTKAPRIEIITVGAGHSGTHTFLVVGRSAGAAGVRPNMMNKGGSFPASSTWGADAVVIDPWLMSLGHDGINLDPVSGPRRAACNSGICDGTQAPRCQSGETHCYTHGETLGFDNGVLNIDRARVV